MKIIDVEPIMEQMKAAIELGRKHGLSTDELEQVLQILKETPEYGRKSETLFLTLEDAVNIAVREFDADPEIAKQEFEQKCYIASPDYEIGRFDGLEEARDLINFAATGLITKNTLKTYRRAKDKGYRYHFNRITGMFELAGEVTENDS